MSETCVLNPSEFTSDLAELSLAELGLEIREDGVDWGESQITPQLVRREQGEVSSDGHRPAVPIRVPIRVRKEGEVSLAEAAFKLQAAVGRWQAETGWIKRVLEEGDFAGALGYRIVQHTAQLSGLQGWLMAHRGVAPEVVLTALRDPIGYSTEEDESEEFSEAEARELIGLVEDTKGSAEGLERVRVTNAGEEDWRALIFAKECRDYSSDVTAKLAYAATELTLRGGSTENEGLVVNSALTAGWLTILSSEIDGAGHMTHRGVRRLFLRAEDTGAAAGDLELRLRWRVLGALRWSENAIVPSPLVDAMQLLDLGECRPQIAVLGDDRWEWELQARAPSGTGGCHIDRVYPLPAEQFAVMSAPDESQSADIQAQQSPETVVSSSESDAGEKAWSNPSNAKTSNDSRATASLTALGGGDTTTQYLKATNLGFAIPEGAVITGVLVKVEKSKTEGGGTLVDGHARLVIGGEVSLAEDKRNSAAWATSDETVTYGGSEDLWSLGTIAIATINASNFGFAITAKLLNISAIAAIDAISVIVYYTEAADPNRVCFAGRSLELRSDGVFRQHPEDDVWGRVVPEGFLPYAVPAGLEGRPSRFILIPSQGALDTIADAGTNPLSATVIDRAGYHFAREAAA